MLNRSHLLRGGAALSLTAVPFASVLYAAETPTLRIERFVFDVRFAEPGDVAKHVEPQRGYGQDTRAPRHVADGAVPAPARHSGHRRVAGVVFARRPVH